MAADSVALLSRDPQVIGDVTRLAAAAGTVPLAVDDPAEMLGPWGRAGVVLVGADAVESLASLRPDRRDQVHVVARGRVGDTVLRAAVSLGAESVAELPEAQEHLVELMTDVADGSKGGACPVVGVISGSGGAGASVFAAALAQTAAIDRSVLLVDADPLGAGLDRVLGLDHAPGIRWDALAQSTGRLSGRSMREALVHQDRLAVLSWPAESVSGLPASALREVLSAGSRGFDLVIVDVPRHGVGSVAETIARCDRLVVMAVASVAGVASASRLLRTVPAGVPQEVVVRTRRGGVPAEDVAGVLGVPMACQMGDQRGLEESVDLGGGPLRSHRGPLWGACRAMLGRIDGAAS